MPSKNFEKLKKFSSWRKLSIATWRAPNNPTVYGQLEVNASASFDYLKDINTKSAVKITVTHLVGKAVALVLKKYPDINGLISFGRIYLRKSVDVFFQVAIPPTQPDEKADLSGSKIENCDQKNLAVIAEELSQAAGQIRKQKDPKFQVALKFFYHIPSFILSILVKLVSFFIYDLGFSLKRLNLSGDPFGSVMITSVGMFQVPPGYAPLVPFSRIPMILCIGEAKLKPWVIGNEIAIAPILNINITLDHRFIDGFTGSQMAKMLVEILENPAQYME